MNDSEEASCVFCKIVRGEIPSIRIYEDGDTLAFLTIEPASAGHTLVIPKEHARNIFEISSESWSTVQETVRIVARAIEKALGADGINVNMNNREHAGQSVEHAHVHIIPRFRNDGLKHFPQHARTEDEGEPVAEKIRAALS